MPRASRGARFRERRARRFFSSGRLRPPPPRASPASRSHPDRSSDASRPLSSPAGFAYEELKADGRQCPVHVYVSTADVDSCCAFRILKSMMCSDGIPFSAYPVSGYQELQGLGEKLPKDGQNRSVVLINCGGTENVKELLGAHHAGPPRVAARPPPSPRRVALASDFKIAHPPRAPTAAPRKSADSVSVSFPPLAGGPIALTPRPVPPLSPPPLPRRPSREHARVRVRQPPPPGPREHALGQQGGVGPPRRARGRGALPRARLGLRRLRRLRRRLRRGRLRVRRRLRGVRRRERRERRERGARTTRTTRRTRAALGGRRSGVAAVARRGARRRGSPPASPPRARGASAARRSSASASRTTAAAPSTAAPRAF